jgi:hypothetical protein
MTVPLSKASRAATLAKRLIDAGVFSEEVLAQELVTSASALRDYCSAKEEIPIDRQLCLALVLMQLPRPWPRLGFQLRNQIEARMHFEERLVSGEIR